MKARVISLSDADVDRIARRTAEVLRGAPADPDPELTRLEAAAYCRMSVRELDRERARWPKVLVAARARRPVLFRRSTLDVYRARRAGLESAA